MGLHSTAAVIPRRGAILLALALLHGCALGPLEGFWPLPGSDRSDLTRAEPPAVRLAVKLPRPARPEARGAILVVRPEAGSGAPATRLAMTLVNEGRTVRSGELPSADPGYWWYLFKLTPAAERDLAALQSRLAAGGEAGRGQAEFTAEITYENVRPGQTVSRSILLQLAGGEDYFSLAEGDHRVGDQPTESRS